MKKWTWGLFFYKKTTASRRERRGPFPGGVAAVRREATGAGRGL